MPQGSAWADIRARIAPDSKALVKKHRKLFFKYLSERHHIWELRRAGTKPPWTANPILRDYHFTNVFRREDWGSQWLIGKLQKAGPIKNKQLVWRVVQYRWPNYHAYFESKGWIPRGFDKKKLVRSLDKFKETQGPWFTNAHIVLQSNFAQSRSANYADYLALLDEQFDDFYNGIRNAKTMEEAFKHVKKFKGFGGFTSYEVLIDLCYLGVLPESFLDEFANPGPGCTEGIRLIYPQAKTGKQLRDAMFVLRDFQDEAWGRYDLAAVPRLTVQDIEFSLCEFSKYVKILHNTGRRRKYRPHASRIRT